MQDPGTWNSWQRLVFQHPLSQCGGYICREYLRALGHSCRPTGSPAAPCRSVSVCASPRRCRRTPFRPGRPTPHTVARALGGLPELPAALCLLCAAMRWIHPLASRHVLIRATANCFARFSTAAGPCNIPNPNTLPLPFPCQVHDPFWVDTCPPCKRAGTLGPAVSPSQRISSIPSPR